MIFLTSLYDHQSLLVHISALSSCLYSQSKYIRSTHIQLLISTTFGPERVAQMPDIPTYSTCSN